MTADEKDEWAKRVEQVSQAAADTSVVSAPQ